MKYTCRCRFIDFAILPIKLLCPNIYSPSGFPTAISRKQNRKNVTFHIIETFDLCIKLSCTISFFLNIEDFFSLPI